MYKHGYRAFEEIRDDDELAFSCQRAGMPPLPAPLAPPDQPPAPNGGGVMGHPVQDACFEPQDRLPLPAAWAGGSRRRIMPVRARRGGDECGAVSARLLPLPRLSQADGGARHGVRRLHG